MLVSNDSPLTSGFVALPLPFVDTSSLAELSGKHKALRMAQQETFVATALPLVTKWVSEHLSSDTGSLKTNCILLFCAKRNVTLFTQLQGSAVYKAISFSNSGYVRFVISFLLYCMHIILSALHNTVELLVLNISQEVVLGYYVKIFDWDVRDFSKLFQVILLCILIFRQTFLQTKKNKT